MKIIWLEEYKTCSCTYIADKKRDLPGYCPKHGTDRKYIIKLPDAPDGDTFDRGYVGA